MSPLVLLLSAVALSYAFCRLIQNRAPAWRLLDHPGERKSQTFAVPRAGGLAILATVTLLFAFSGAPVVGFRALGALVVFAGGFYDDRHPSNTVTAKLAFQMAGAALAVAGFAVHHQLPILLLSGCFCFIIVLINSFNLMDNMNGLTAGMSLAIAVALFGLKEANLNETLILCGALLGFLALNFPFGRIYLGDQGSQLLGYWMSVGALEKLAKNYDMAPTFATIGSASLTLAVLFLPLILDTALVIVIRKRNGQPITVGDQNHLSHQLLKLGMGRTAAPLVLVSFECLCAVSVWLLAGR